jgi:hypothetical protein
LLRDGALGPEVLGVVDRPLRGADRGQLGREDRVAVQEQVDAIAPGDGRAEVRLERFRERRIRDGHRRDAFDGGWLRAHGRHEQ